MQPQFLTSAQVEQFLTRGFVQLKGAIERDVALNFAKGGWDRLGYDPADVSTWAHSPHHLPQHRPFSLREHAPDVLRATADLVGAEWGDPDWHWGDAFIFNLGDDSDAPWQAPADLERGWHKDGDFFQHFLDSPEQAILSIVLWSDIEPFGGGTFAACDSVGPVARFLAAHPEGVSPNGFPFLELKNQCHDFIEITGRAGDAFLLHPFLLHSASRNATRSPRVISNPPTYLSRPMNFNRENPDDFSLVERAITNGLGVERYDFRATGTRERIVPQRVIEQQKMEASSAN